MFRVNQKTGDISLAPSALGGLITLVFGFAVWMTKMQYDVSGWNEAATKIAKIERVLLYNRLESPDLLGNQWPDPSQPSPYWPALSSSPGVVTKRE
jgi:hypothetical protein